MIYAAETFAGAMLEVLVHANLSHIPRTHRSVRIEIPESLIETVNGDDVPGWEKQDLLASRAFGDSGGGAVTVASMDLRAGDCRPALFKRKYSYVGRFYLYVVLRISEKLLLVHSLGTLN